MKKKIFHANEHIFTLQDLQIEKLKKKGIKCIAFDVNGTLIYHGKIVKSASKKIRELKEAGFQITILSNNPFLDKKVEKLVQLNKKYIKGLAMKPFPQGYRYIEKVTDCTPNEIAMITNNSLLDIFGANRRGFYTIKVLEHELKMEREIRGIKKIGKDIYYSRKKPIRTKSQQARAFRSKQRKACVGLINKDRKRIADMTHTIVDRGEQEL